MNKPDLMLSSIIRNSEKFVIDQNIRTEDKNYIERVKQLKLEILKGVVDPSEVDLVQPEIIDSWIRSRNYGLEVHQSPRTSTVIPKADMENLLVENSILINATLSSLSQFEPLLHANYDILLSDPNGVFLLTMLGENNNIAYKNFNLAPGTVWNEKTIGTSAMSLVPLLKRPIQVCGPEIYLERFLHRRQFFRSYFRYQRQLSRNSEHRYCQLSMCEFFQFKPCRLDRRAHSERISACFV